MTRSLLRVFRAALILTVLLGSVAAWAKTETVEVTYDLDDEGCVTNIDVDPETVQFSYRAHRWRWGYTKVLWNLKHGANEAVDTKFSVVKVSSDYPVCKDEYEFSLNVAPCNVANRFWGKSNWEYKIVAEKAGCDTKMLDPAIIFRKGKTGGIVIVWGLAAAAIVALIIYYLRRRRRPRPSTR